MGKPLLLDLFCCEGGAARGYADAGFNVIGVDIDPQPRYPYDMAVGDAIELLRQLIDGRTHPVLGFALSDFDAIHASPPCQAFTKAKNLQGNQHPELIVPTRELLTGTGLPYVIENVEGAPLNDPVMLCGPMFGLATYRHRLFESNVRLTAPEHPEHSVRTTKMGRPPQPGEFMHIVGNFSGVDRARDVMGMDWASQHGLAQAIPPAYTNYIGGQLLAHINEGETK